MAEDTKRSSAIKALRAIRSEAGRAALGDRLPEGKRASEGFLLSIGISPQGAPEDDDEDDTADGG